MTLDQIIKIQQLIDKRAIACDTKEFLNTRRFSESKNEWIRFGDMHIDHFLRVFQKTGISLSPEEIKTFVKNHMEKELDEIIMHKNFNHWKNVKKN
tara:strand:+ start:343 stop:630 length:288 start_codon:yes stop_codon:yes gene_type:complete